MQYLRTCCGTAATHPFKQVFVDFVGANAPTKSTKTCSTGVVAAGDHTCTDKRSLAFIFCLRSHLREIECRHQGYAANNVPNERREHEAYEIGEPRNCSGTD